MRSDYLTNMEIPEEEWENVLQKKSFKHLLFCFYKYHKNEFADILKNCRTLEEFNKDAIIISKSDDPKKIEKYNQCVTEIEKSYKHLHYQFTRIRKNFNVIGLELNKLDSDTIYFWYTLLLRIHLRSNIWSKIGAMHNHKRRGFLSTYEELKTKEEKKEFVEEIDFFINGCIHIITKKSGESDAVLFRENIYNIINYEFLELKCFFETYDLRDCIQGVKILDTDEMLSNPVFLKKIGLYRHYLSKIKTSITECIDAVNKEFATDLFPLFSETSNLVDNLDESEDVPLIKEKMVRKLKEIDAVAYRKLTVKNFDMLINQTDLTQTESEQQIQFDKIQKDLMEIFEKDHSLANEAFEQVLTEGIEQTLTEVCEHLFPFLL